MAGGRCGAIWLEVIDLMGDRGGQSPSRIRDRVTSGRPLRRGRYSGPRCQTVISLTRPTATFLKIGNNWKERTSTPGCPSAACGMGGRSGLCPKEAFSIQLVAKSSLGRVRLTRCGLRAGGLVSHQAVPVGPPVRPSLSAPCRPLRAGGLVSLQAVPVGPCFLCQELVGKLIYNLK